MEDEQNALPSQTPPNKSLEKDGALSSVHPSKSMCLFLLGNCYSTGRADKQEGHSQKRLVLHSKP